MIKSNILKLKKYLSVYQIDGYVIPKNDEFFSEFDRFDRLKKFQILVVQLVCYNYKKK